MATYTANEIVTLTGNTNLFINSLVRQMVAAPNIVNNSNWFSNLSKAQTFLDCADNAGFYNEQFNAQFCLDADYELYNNQQYFF